MSAKRRFHRLSPFSGAHAGKSGNPAKGNNAEPAQAFGSNTLPERKKSTATALLLLLLATVTSRFTGFFREIVTGSALGTTNISDAYLASVSVPNILLLNVAGALGTTFIPIYIQIKSRDGNKKSAEFASNVINITFFAYALFAVITVIFSQQIISVLFYGFDDATKAMTTDISNIIFFCTIFLGVNAIFSSYLESNNRFALNALNSVTYNAIVISALLSYKQIGIRGVAIATLAGTFFQTLYLLINALVSGYRYKPVLNLKDKAVRDLLLLALPVFLGNSVTQIGALIDRTLASDLAQGSLSALNYSNRLTIFVYSITSLAIGTVIYPRLSEYSTENNIASFTRLVTKGINIVTILLLPITVASCILCGPVIKLLFERGAFDSNSSALTASVLFYYSLGMVFVGCRDILNRAFYSIRDAKTPMICNAVSIIANILLSIIFSRFMAHTGLALATSISAAVSVGLLLLSLRKKLGGAASNINGKQIAITFAKSSVSAAVMGIAVYFCNDRLSEYFFGGASARLIMGSGRITEVFILLIVVCAGLLVYGFFLLVLKTEEIKWALSYAAGIVKSLRRKK